MFRGATLFFPPQKLAPFFPPRCESGRGAVSFDCKTKSYLALSIDFCIPSGFVAHVPRGNLVLSPSEARPLLPPPLRIGAWGGELRLQNEVVLGVIDRLLHSFRIRCACSAGQPCSFPLRSSPPSSPPVANRGVGR